MTRHHSCRVSPFGHPRIHARLAAPRGISQPPTSFIGSQCQGIHHAPLNTYKHKTNIEIAHQQDKKTPARPESRTHAPCSLDARNHYPQIKHHTPPPSEATTTTPWRVRRPPVPPKGRRGHTGLLSQSPIVCSVNSRRPAPPKRHTRKASTFVVAPEPAPTTGPAHPTNRLSHRTPATCGRAQVSWCSLERR